MARIFVAHQEQGTASPFGGVADAIKEQRLMAEEQRRYEQNVQQEAARLGLQAKQLEYQKERDRIGDRFKRREFKLREEELQVNRELAQRRVAVAEGGLGLQKEQFELTKSEAARLADLEERKMALSEAEQAELSELRQKQQEMAERKEAREAKESEATIEMTGAKTKVYEAQASALEDEKADAAADREVQMLTAAQGVSSHFSKIGTIPVDQLPTGAEYISNRRKEYEQVLADMSQPGVTDKQLKSYGTRLDLMMAEDDVLIEKSQAEWTLTQYTTARQKLVDELTGSEEEYGLPVGAVEKAYNASTSDPKEMAKDIERLRELKALGQAQQALAAEFLQISSGGLTGPNASAITAAWNDKQAWMDQDGAAKDAWEAYQSIDSSMEQRVEAGRYLLARTHLEADPQLRSVRNAMVTTRQELEANKRSYQASLDMLSAVSQQHLPPMDQSLAALAALESPEAAAELGIQISPEAAELAGELNNILGAATGTVSDQAKAGMMGKQSLYSSLALASEQLGGLAPETAAELFGVLTELRPGGRYEAAGPKIVEQLEAALAEQAQAQKESDPRERARTNKYKGFDI